MSSQELENLVRGIRQDRVNTKPPSVVKRSKEKDTQKTKDALARMFNSLSEEDKLALMSKLKTKRGTSNAGS